MYVIITNASVIFHEFNYRILYLPYNANHSWWKTFAIFMVLLSTTKVFQWIFYNKVFLGLNIMENSGPGSGPGLLRYFKPCKKDSCQILLPDLTGPLSAKVYSAAIQGVQLS